MSHRLKDKVAIVTGAGRGLGREHALLLAREGAKVVVNDLGGDPHGTGADTAPAQQVVEEIEAEGGHAVANYDNVADWEGAQRLVDQAIEISKDGRWTIDELVEQAPKLQDFEFDYGHPLGTMLVDGPRR